MSQCTWKDPDKPRCPWPATHAQEAGDGSVWANLCEFHHDSLEAVVGVDVKKTLSYWVRAQGGSRAAADRMAGV